MSLYKNKFGGKRNKMAEKLNFYDVKGKQKFSTDKYSIKVIKGRRFAVAKAPSGIDAYRIIGKAK